MAALLRRKETWGIVLGKALTDPVWFFITDWFAIYLVSKGFRLENTLTRLLGSVPCRRPRQLRRRGALQLLHPARVAGPASAKLVVLLGGIGMTLLIPAIAVSNFAVIIALFAISTFSYAAWSTMGLTFPADLYPKKCRGDRERHERRSGGRRDHAFHLADRQSHGPLFFPARSDRREPGAGDRDRAGIDACSA